MESKEKLESRLSEAIKSGCLSSDRLQKLLDDLEIEFIQAVNRLHALVCSDQNCNFMQGNEDSVSKWKSLARNYMEKYRLSLKDFNATLTDLTDIGRIFAKTIDSNLLWELVQLSNDRSYVQNLNGVVEGIIVEGEEDGEASSERTSSNGSGSKQQNDKVQDV